jgi:hypothetical protein
MKCARTLSAFLAGVVVGAVLLSFVSSSWADKLPAYMTAVWTLNSPRIILVACDECQECKKRGIPTHKTVRSVVVGLAKYQKSNSADQYAITVCGITDNKLRQELLSDARLVHDENLDWVGIVRPADFESKLKEMTASK